MRGKEDNQGIESKKSNNLLIIEVSSFRKCIVSRSSNPDLGNKNRILRSSIVHLIKSCILNIKFVLIIPFQLFNHTLSLSLIYARLSLKHYF